MRNIIESDLRQMVLDHKSLRNHSPSCPSCADKMIEAADEIKRLEVNLETLSA